MNSCTRFFLPLFALIIAISHPLEAHPHIAVIGAGFSGEVAAHRLKQQGYEGHVFEARARVGGRVLSAQMYHPVDHVSYTIELGAHNISDGGEAKELRALISEMGLTITEAPPSTSLMSQEIL